MVWVVSRVRFKVETSLTRSHTSISSWLNPRQRSPRWRGPHHERQPAHQLIEHPSTLIADYRREEKKTCFLKLFFILRRIQRDIVINAHGTSWKVPLFLSDLHETEIFSTDFRKILQKQISWKTVQLEPICSVRTERRTDWQTHDERWAAFRSFPKVSKKQAFNKVALSWIKKPSPTMGILCTRSSVIPVRDVT